MIDRRLIRKINKGHCFALIGAGASTEMGYPSWKTLAHQVVSAVRSAGKMSDEASYEKYVQLKQIPELLMQAERDLGGRAALIDVLKGLVVAKAGSPDQVYSILTDWPFACYLTTNWDNELDAHLRRLKVFYKTLQNSRDDFALLRHDAESFIVKLHSDLEHPDLAVITSADYAKLLSAERKYFSDRLRSIFEMFDVLVVGHSLSDPDLRLILQIAKETASPEHPVFLMAADLTKAEEIELLERFNVVAIRYENLDGNHSQLRRQLTLMSKFIIPRRQRIDVAAVPYTTEELEAAQAVAIYRRFAAAKPDELQPAAYVAPLILQTLTNCTGAVTENDLLGLPPLSSASTTLGVAEIVPHALEDLRHSELIEWAGGSVALTAKGREQALEFKQRRALEEDQAFGQFITEVQASCKPLKDDEQRHTSELLKDTLVRVFKQRGFSIANAVFSGQTLDRDTLSDVFEAVSGTAAGLKDRELALSFMEAAQGLLLRPSDAQKKYLASLSQGFFLYHLFGLDPQCAKIRRDVFRETIWWCDASTLLPLIAIGCENNLYAEDLFSRLQNLNALTLTTSRLLREVLEHLEWAARLFQRQHPQSSLFLSAATDRGSYKQNLFVDGFVRLSAEGRIGKPEDYTKLVAPFGATEEGIRKLLEKRGIRAVNISELDGFDNSTDTRAMFELSYEIAQARTRAATLRSAQQVEAEAEVLLIIRGLKEGRFRPPVTGFNFERSYFLSQSRVLDRIPPAEPVSWTPEALYRYIISLPGEDLDPNLLHRCMLQEYFASGVVIFDTVRYEKFFGPSINAATTTFAAERDKYLAEFPQATGAALDEAFEATPDLQKPFFVQQMGWKLAREQQRKAEAAEQRAEVAQGQAEAAVTELKRIEQERDKDWQRRKKIRAQQLDAEKRNLGDPKHQKKRQRQAKKRRRKGKR